MQPAAARRTAAVHNAVVDAARGPGKIPARAAPAPRRRRLAQSSLHIRWAV